MLKTLQQQFYRDVLNPKSAKLYLDKGDFRASDLIQIYHNQYFTSLLQALEKTYACIKRLVGEDFFKTLAMRFIQNYPSKSGNITDYGDEFSYFIEHDPHCSRLPYLSDVAKFERLYERCYFSTNTEFFMHSQYPIIKIWQLTKSSETLDFSTGGEYLKIHKQGVQVIVQRISKQHYEQKNA